MKNFKFTMKNNFNYGSCTSKEQSKRLIDLGLKPSTADMHLEHIGDGIIVPGIGYHNLCSIDYMPAWSLTRLIEICGENLNALPTRSNPFNYIIDLISDSDRTDNMKKYFVEK